ncbi:MAG: hypothetical protein CO029_03455 [Candidatus Magasanikbacteria bacterium CG_4_9_14_0_2_um_filter_41_10]|nr:MAG: hypothetical protein CO029_03455 [Candidatus Magasanikbacteria bacterium CG_4_9_14_0_2_um_filter_41_10]
MATTSGMIGESLDLGLVPSPPLKHSILGGVFLFMCKNICLISVSYMINIGQILLLILLQIITDINR